MKTFAVNGKFMADRIQEIVRYGRETLRQYRTNEVVRWNLNFPPDAIAKIEGLLDVNQDFCKKQTAKIHFQRRR